MTPAVKEAVPVRTQPSSTRPRTAHSIQSRQSYLLAALALLAVLISAPLALGPNRPPLLLLIAGPAAVAGMILVLRPVWSIYLLLAIWTVYPVLLRLLGLEQNTLVKAHPEAIIAATLLGTFLWWMSQRRRLQVTVRLPDIAVALLLVGAVVAALSAPSLEAIVFGFRVTYLPVLFYFMVRLLPLSQIDIKRWVWMFIAMAVVLAAFGIFFQVTGPQRWYPRLIPADVITNLMRKGVWRMSSLLLNPLYFGPVMAMAGLFSFALLISSRSWLWALLFALFTVCMYYSQTRGAYIMLGLGVAVILAVWALRDYSLLILSLVLVLLVLTALLVAGLTGGQFDFIRDSGGGILSSRYDEINASLQAFAARPLGYGLGVGQAQRKFTIDTGSALQVYDGWYFKVMLEGGLLGILLFVTFQIAIVWYLLQKVLTRRSRFAFTLHLTYLAIFIGGAAQAIVTNLWEHYMVNGVLWVLLALCTTLNRDGSTTPLIVPQPALRASKAAPLRPQPAPDCAPGAT